MDVSEVARPKANRSSLVLSSGIPELRPLRSTRVTGRHHYYGPLRHLARPSLLLAEVSLSVTHAHRAGLPVLRSISSYVHADANTPAERSGAYVTRFPGRDGLPRFDFGSTSAIGVSRRAQRSLTFRPARSLSPQGTLFWKCFSPGRYLPEPLPVLPAGATEAGWDSHPLKIAALTRHTSKNVPRS